MKTVVDTGGFVRSLGPDLSKLAMARPSGHSCDCGQIALNVSSTVYHAIRIISGSVDLCQKCGILTGGRDGAKIMFLGIEHQLLPNEVIQVRPGRNEK